MDLLVDVGNTRIKWATLSKGKLSEMGSLEHKSKRFGHSFPSWSEYSNVKRIFVSNVAGERMEKYITRWCEKQWSTAPEFVVPKARKFRITNGYKDPEQMGADRWAILVAAKASTNMAACVVDCGTAVTCDVLDSRGKHLGGFILPGPGLTQEMLIKHTQIPETKLLDAPTQLLGTDTATCISGGVYYSIVATLDRVVEDLRQELGLGIKLIMTGGNAEKIAKLAMQDWDVRPTLVLDGLKIIAQGK